MITPTAPILPELELGRHAPFGLSQGAVSNPVDTLTRRERALRDALEAVLLAESSEYAELAGALDRRDGWHGASNATTASLLHVDLLIAAAKGGGQLSAGDVLPSVEAIRLSLERIRDFVGRGRVSSAQGLNSIAPPVAAPVLVGELVERCRQDHPQVRWAVECPEPPTLLVQDVPLLRRAFLHLLENAAEGDGQRAATSVTVRVAQSVAPALIILQVKDDGPGFDHARLQAPAAALRSSKPDRVGVGLFMCHRVALAIGGKLKLENHPGGALAELAVRPVVPARP